MHAARVSCLLLIACTQSAAPPFNERPAIPADVDCIATCPINTRRVELSGVQAAQQGALVIVEERCEATCVPAR